MQSVKENSKPSSVYFLVPAPPGNSPGQRFRFEHYLRALEQNGIRFRISPFYSQNGWNILFSRSKRWNKVAAVIRGFGRRFLDMFRLSGYTHVYIYREAAPLGPPVFEWILAKLLRKKIVYDFDDAIWIPVTTSNNRGLVWLRSFGKVARICRWSETVTVGNRFLADFAEKHAGKVVMIPTVVDTEEKHKKIQDHHVASPAIGWTGTFSTLKYLQIILPVIQELQKTYPFTFIVIADKDPQLPLERYRFIRWNRETEIDDLLNFHIGVMPLSDDPISKGKCGFKAIQYLSLGIPAVVSPVGVNAMIVEEGINGFLCTTPEEWMSGLELLLKDEQLRVKMGQYARRQMEDKYSVKATTSLFLSIFQNDH